MNPALPAVAHELLEHQATTRWPSLRVNVRTGTGLTGITEVVLTLAPPAIHGGGASIYGIISIAERSTIEAIVLEIEQLLLDLAPLVEQHHGTPPVLPDISPLHRVGQPPSTGGGMTSRQELAALNARDALHTIGAHPLPVNHLENNLGYIWPETGHVHGPAPKPRESPA